MSSSAISVPAAVRWLFLIVAAYALAALAALAFSDDLAAVIAAAPPRLLLAAPAAALAAYLLRAARWSCLLRAARLKIPWSAATRIYFGGFPMTLTPGRVGELWRAWALAARCGVPYRRALPPVFCDRLLDLVALLLFALLGAFVSVSQRAAAFLALAIFLPPLALLLRPAWGIAVVKGLWRLVGKKRPRLFAAPLVVFRNLAVIVRPSAFLPALALSLLAWGAEALVIVIAAAELGGRMPLAAAAAVLGLGNIAGVLTFLPGGIGGQEAAMIYLVRDNGNPLAVAVAVVGVARAATLLFSALLGLPFFVGLSRRRSAG